MCCSALLFSLLSFTLKALPCTVASTFRRRCEHTKSNVETESERDRSTYEECYMRSDGAMVRRRCDDGTVTVKWEKPTWRVETINNIPFRLALFSSSDAFVFLFGSKLCVCDELSSHSMRFRPVAERKTEGNVQRTKAIFAISVISIFDATWSAVSVCSRYLYIESIPNAEWNAIHRRKILHKYWKCSIMLKNMMRTKRRMGRAKCVRAQGKTGGGRPLLYMQPAAVKENRVLFTIFFIRVVHIVCKLLCWIAFVWWSAMERMPDDKWAKKKNTRD